MVKKISYACPVLGNNEDYQYNAIFTFPSVKWTLHENNLGVTFSFPIPEINDEVLFELFEKGEAHLTLVINSARSYFQKTLNISFEDFKENNFQIFFNYGDLNGDVTFQFFLKSNVDKLIKTNLVSEDYDDPFYISINDILAKTPEWNELIDHKFDPHSSKPTSFIQVTNFDEIETKVSFDNNEIIIRLPNEIYEEYKNLDMTTGPILHSSIVLPVLTQAIRFIKDPEHNSHSSEDWYSKLDQMIDVKKLSNENELTIASKLLKDPINKGIVYLSNTQKKNLEGEE